MLIQTLVGLLALSNSAVLSPQLVAQAAQITPQQEWLTALASCESGGDWTIKHLDSNGYFSYSGLQFQMSSWLAFSDRFGTTKDNIYDQALQEEVATYMLDHGEQDAWYTCSRRVEKDIGDWPV